jgi:hypothetical protein
MKRRKEVKRKAVLEMYRYTIPELLVPEFHAGTINKYHIHLHFIIFLSVHPYFAFKNNIKGKAVPLHAMKALGGRGV